MTDTYTTSQTQTRTITHAERIAVNIATDLRRIQIQGRKNSPTDLAIEKYQKEATVLLHYGLLKEVMYGFKSLYGQWSWTVVYRVNASSGILEGTDDPGGIYFTGCPVGNFTSFLSYNDRWHQLTDVQQENINKEILNKSGISRGYGDIPNIALTGANRNYKSGNLEVQRFFAA